MDDYRDAAQRHLDDANFLFAQDPQRLANASHLYGISSECSLKAVAQKLDSTARFHGAKGHIPSLFDELSNVAPGLDSNAALVDHIHRLKPKFLGWNVNQRYESQAGFIASTVSDNKDGATEAHLLMSNCLSGLI